MNHKNVPIPKRLQKRPRDSRGYLIPFTVPIVNGIPQFRTTNMERVSLCIRTYCCGLCGDELVGWNVGIAGPDEIEKKVFTDPAMHEECARYATQVCPFLNRSDFKYLEPHRMEGATLIENPFVAKKRPQQLALCFFKRYEAIQVQTGGKLIPAIKVDRFHKVETF